MTNGSVITNCKASRRRFTQCEVVRQGHVRGQATGSTGHIARIFSIDYVKLFTKETFLFRTLCFSNSWVNINVLSVLEQGIESWIASAFVMDDSTGFDEELCPWIRETTRRFWI